MPTGTFFNPQKPSPLFPLERWENCPSPADACSQTTRIRQQKDCGLRYAHQTDIGLQEKHITVSHACGDGSSLCDHQLCAGRVPRSRPSPHGRLRSQQSPPAPCTWEGTAAPRKEVFSPRYTAWPTLPQPWPHCPLELLSKSAAPCHLWLLGP